MAVPEAVIEPQGAGSVTVVDAGVTPEGYTRHTATAIPAEAYEFDEWEYRIRVVDSNGNVKSDVTQHASSNPLENALVDGTGDYDLPTSLYPPWTAVIVNIKAKFRPVQPPPPPESSYTYIDGIPSGSGTVQFTVREYPQVSGDVYSDIQLTSATPSSGFVFDNKVRFRWKYEGDETWNDVERDVTSFPFEYPGGGTIWGPGVTVQIWGFFKRGGPPPSPHGIIFSPTRDGKIVFDLETGQPMFYP